MMATESYRNETQSNSTSMSSIQYCNQNKLCGSHGYCNDDPDSTDRCLCKFWWKGNYCERLSGSGKQVIIIGSLLFILMILFHCFPLIKKVRQRGKQRPNVKSTIDLNSIQTESPIESIFIESKSRHFQSFLIATITILLTIVALVIKWILLKNIHQNIIEKHHRNQSLFFERNSFCRVIDTRSEFNVITFPIALFLLIIFSLTTKRKSFQREKICWGYVGLPMPFDFFSSVKRTFIAVIFAIFADELVEIANDLFFKQAPASDEGIIITYLRQVLKVFIIGLRRYPILAATYLRTPIALACASLYIWLDFSVTLLDNSLCQNDFYPSDKTYDHSTRIKTLLYLNYYGTGWKLIFFPLLVDIPRFLCLSYISVKLPAIFIKRIFFQREIDQEFSPEQKILLHSSLPTSAESRYVRKLFGHQSSKQPTQNWMKYFEFIYQWRDDFRFSSRVLCTYSAIFLLLFFFTVKAGIQITPLLVEIQRDCEELVSLGFYLVQFQSAGSMMDRKKFPLPNFSRPYTIAVSLSAVVITVQLLVMLASIRRNLFQLYRGDDCEIPRRSLSQHISYINGNVRFAGSLIGYVVLAYVFLAFLLLLITVGIETLIVYGNIRLVENVLKLIIPTLLFTLFKIYLNNVLGQYVFLQPDGKILTVNNRRVFILFMYFNFFLDAFLGFFAAIIRVLKSVFGGILYMCRLDYSPLGRKLEMFDDGFNAYCGFLQIEATHRHPVLLCFMSHLLRDSLNKTQTRRWTNARRKWSLAVFLLNNPTLIYRRKQFHKYETNRSMKLTFIARKYFNDKSSMFDKDQTNKQTNENPIERF